jgi:hypothetical protein
MAALYEQGVNLEKLFKGATSQMEQDDDGISEKPIGAEMPQIKLTLRKQCEICSKSLAGEASLKSVRDRRCRLRSQD